MIFDKRKSTKGTPPVRSIVNVAELAAALRTLPSVAVEVVDPSRLDLRGQIALLLGTDMLLTPCGGISLLLGFLRPGSVVSMLDYWDPAMEVWAWKTQCGA